MPIYEYRCSQCGAEFERKRSFSEAEAPAQCPQCGGESRKLPSMFASKDGYAFRIPSGTPYRGQGS